MKKKTKPLPAWAKLRSPNSMRIYEHYNRLGDLTEEQFNALLDLHEVADRITKSAVAQIREAIPTLGASAGPYRGQLLLEVVIQQLQAKV